MATSTLPTPLRESVRVEATRLRPGHTIRLEYGRNLLLAVHEVHVEKHLDPPCARTCGWLSLPGGEPFEYTTTSRHLPSGRMKVVADRNEPPVGIEPAWHDLTRVVRRWSGKRCMVWSLDDPHEPLGHGGRLRGTVCMTAAGWRWRAAYQPVAGRVRGDYLDAERALLAATGDDEERSARRCVAPTRSTRTSPRRTVARPREWPRRN